MSESKGVRYEVTVRIRRLSSEFTQECVAERTEEVLLTPEVVPEIFCARQTQTLLGRGGRGGAGGGSAARVRGPGGK